MSETNPTQTGFARDYILSNKQYNVLKQISQIVLPAVGTLYFALSQIWGFPYGEEVVGSVTAIGTFMGVLLNRADKSYNNSEAKYAADLNVVETDEGQYMSLGLNYPPEVIAGKDEVILKVVGRK